MSSEVFRNAVAALTVRYDEFEATKIASVLAHEGLLKEGLTPVEQEGLETIRGYSDRLEELYRHSLLTEPPWTKGHTLEADQLEASLAEMVPVLIKIIERLK